MNETIAPRFRPVILLQASDETIIQLLGLQEIQQLLAKGGELSCHVWIIKEREVDDEQDLRGAFSNCRGSRMTGSSRLTFSISPVSPQSKLTRLALGTTMRRWSLYLSS